MLLASEGSVQAWRLDGKRIVVTGGSKGIGAGIVEELVRHGAEVFTIARGQGALDVLAARTGATPFRADVRDTEAIVGAIRARWDGLDGLVNNAGINIRKPFDATEPEDLDTILGVNLGAAFHLTRALTPLLAARRGAVVNVSSVASTHAVRTSTPTYAASKGGLDALTRYLAAVLGPRGIRVNAVSPWYVRTPLAEQVLRDPASKEAILDRTPLGRIGEPADVARAVAFLLMPASGWITGVDLPVDGGFSTLGV